MGHVLTGPLPPDEAARQVPGPYRRHAREVTGAVDRAPGEYRPAIRRWELPATCLLRLVTADGPSPDEQPNRW
jgi:hypothetical protein